MKHPLIMVAATACFLGGVAFNSMEPPAPLWQVLGLIGAGAVLSIRAMRSR